ncbi:MAG TPA: acyl-CoA dehydrogenase family protein [Solirubrobacterales bacterium]|jgi:alkylation response protein AidB-like acyl-CoA dehydrogenase
MARTASADGVPGLPLELDLDDEQRQLAEATRGFLARHYPVADARAVLEAERVRDAEGWRRAAEMGWAAVLAGEEISGLEAGPPEATVVAEEHGRAVNWAPFLGNALATAALAGSGSELLGRVVAGEASAAWAGPEPRGESWGAEGVRAEARREREGFVVAGVKRLVADADLATDLVVTARLDGRLTDFVVPVATPGVTIEPARTLDLTRRFPTVKLEGVAVGAGAEVVGADGGSSYEAVLDLAALLVAADSVGAGERLLEMTVEYALDRIAFGRPIGSYQAVKHFCADMLLRVEASRVAVRNAGLLLGAGDPGAARAVAVATSYTADATTWIAGTALQVHGGIGFTWEHDLHLYLRRIEADAALFGSAREQRRRLAEMVL